jgi:hypothetical protein
MGREGLICMSVAPKMNQTVGTHNVAAELIGFLAQYSALLDQQILSVRNTLLGTVEQAMSGVMALNAAADFKLRKADEVLVRDQTSGFVSKSAKDLDSSFKDPSAKVKNINETLSAHMSGLSNLDESVRGFLFAIMGGLSMDDVVRLRLEHVSAALVAQQAGINQLIAKYNAGEKVTEAFIEEIQLQMLKVMFKAYTMEDEKIVFKRVFGSVKGINQKP